MERLTERTVDGILVKENYEKETLKTLHSCYGEKPNPHYTNCEEGYYAMEKLADYEDLEEQGRLLKLLCNRGDEVYFIKSAFSLAHFPIKAKITRICGVDCDNDVMYVSNTEYNGIDRHFKQSDIGKTVFLAKSEAEAKLKELRGGENE